MLSEPDPSITGSPLVPSDPTIVRRSQSLALPAFAEQHDVIPEAMRGARSRAWPGDHSEWTRSQITSPYGAALAKNGEEIIADLGRSVFCTWRKIGRRAGGCLGWNFHNKNVTPGLPPPSVKTRCSYGSMWPAAVN
jgi:hypothetical protein